MSRDDAIREERARQKAMPKVSEGQKRENRKILNEIIVGNKRKRDEAMKLEDELQEAVLLDGFKRLEDHSDGSIDTAEKEFQNVIDYYR